MRTLNKLAKDRRTLRAPLKILAACLTLVLMICSTAVVQGAAASAGLGTILSREEEKTAYVITPLTDYDTGKTLARCYAPSDYSAEYVFMNSLSGEGECSVACPFQVRLIARNPDKFRNMSYYSEMRYLYPPSPERVFEEGKRFGITENTMLGYPLETMMYPCSALEYADKMALAMNPNKDLYRAEIVSATDEEDPFLAQQSRTNQEYFNVENPFSFLFEVVCDGVKTTYAEVTYYADVPDAAYYFKVVTSTCILHFTGIDHTTGLSCDFAETVIPYYFSIFTPAWDAEEAFAEFDLFVANTRVSDEFVLMNQMESQILHESVSGNPMDDSHILDILGDGDGSYYEDRFSDYILDQNEYLDSDGRTFKVPTSYDYVYEKDDGEIYVTNGTEQPAGSKRLYPR
ncbi:MAG: hypothetical protein IJ106_05650 [Parasporobacterium sp.]|nr:hypothetical protein [Parasporobacterium sp.]